MSSILDEVVEVPRRTLVLFFIVDCSGSMAGEKIGEVNYAIQEIIPEIQNISENNADAQIKIAVLKFSQGAEWITPVPVNAEDFRWNDLNAYGGTSLGRACEMLSAKLSKKEFMSDATGSYAPVLFLLSDGIPTDDYDRGLEKLKENKWYKVAAKVAIAIGGDADKEKLAKFTGNSEMVITVHTPEALRFWIQFLAVRSSQIASKSSNAVSAGNGAMETKQEQLEKEIRKEKEENGDPSDGEDEWDV